MTDTHASTGTRDAPDPRAWWSGFASSWTAVWVFVLAITGARLVWMIVFSEYTLIEDEAHYWEWSRRPGWSYYSKGPGVAWAIWASCSLFGNVEWAVRLPAVLASAVGSLAAAGMARDAFKGRAVPFIAAVLYQCVPAYAITAVLMTIDGPFVACWTLACWMGTRAVLKDDRRAWVAFGLAIALGFLFKYTILLLVPGVAIGALVAGDRARLKRHAGWIALGALGACLGLIPVGIWNANHDWATVRHLLGHLGLQGGDSPATAGREWSALWAPEYVGLTLAACGPVMVLGVLAWLERRHAGRGVAFSIACALPILAMYLAVSLVAQVEGNWAVAGCASLVAPAAWLVADGVARRDLAVRFLWGGALACGLGVLIGFPLLSALARTGELGRKIPVHRLTGMREHASAAQTKLDALRAQTGQDPFVLSEHYGRASQLAFYLPGNPTVYCASPLVGGRRTQYDEWAQTDLSNPDTLAPLRGRPALLFGGQPAQWAIAFDPVFDLGPLAGEPKRNRTTYAGYDFTSFDGWRHGWATNPADPTRTTPNPSPPGGAP